MLVRWLDFVTKALADLAPQDSVWSLPNVIQGLFAVVLVCIICGAVGSLVVGNRMAFFSDALAHCAFAGVGIGMLIGIIVGSVKNDAFDHWGVPLITVLFGMLTGLAIAYVKEKSVLANDTVIGVFFAGAIGFGAMLFKTLNVRSYVSPETILFGDPLYVGSGELLVLFLLFICTAALLFWLYNRFVFSSFNPSLARSRQISMRLFNYVFIVLLALIVNLSLKIVGALLINALLIVPAAAAANISRNMRQMFWLSIFLSLVSGLVGAWCGQTLGFRDPGSGEMVHFGWSGTIVVLSVLLFFLSLFLGPWVRGRQTT
jgi:zinc transport system permease protein